MPRTIGNLSFINRLTTFNIFALSPSAFDVVNFPFNVIINSPGRLSILNVAFPCVTGNATLRPRVNTTDVTGVALGTDYVYPIIDYVNCIVASGGVTSGANVHLYSVDDSVQDLSGTASNTWKIVT